MKTKTSNISKTTSISSAIAFASLASTPVLAQSDINISAVLDGYYQEDALSEGLREDGFNLGHSELALSAPVDDSFYGKMTLVVASHEGEVELELEEAFIQTTALPAGFGIRAGRMLSDIGYLNNQHLHTDSFSERPIAYRAMLGSHYADDGIRLNWVAPTETYIALGAEVFAGDALALEDAEPNDSSIGVSTLYAKMGGDIGNSNSWQLGAAYLRNESGQLHPEEHHDAHGAHDADADHGAHGDEDGHDDHGHGPAYGGKNMAIFDATYKWAPNGNYKYQSLTLSAELLIADDLYEEVDLDEQNTGWYVSGIYQINPNWSVASRYGKFKGWSFHEFHTEADGTTVAEFEAEETTNTSLSVGWHPSHFSVIRLFATKEETTGDSSSSNTIVGIGFNTAIGAHGAHAY
ncbi:MAG: hypothetical protein ABNH02_07030 [Pseudomonadales bacterium]|jgi:hypothetical protein